MAPSAPTLLSTITGWPIAAETDWPRMRVMVSVAEPAGNGTTTRIGLLGNCAYAVAAKNSHAAASTDKRFMQGLLTLRADYRMAEWRSAWKSESSVWAGWAPTWRGAW